MEKARQAIQGISRMLFSQCTEIINPATNRGLPPNLVAEDPSVSPLFKGTDLNIAALAAELGFLANPVNHVQTAEMGNQSLNSLALISARYTHTAIEVLAQLIAAHLVALCQALDLRAMHIQFFESYPPEFFELVARHCEVNEISGEIVNGASIKVAGLNGGSDPSTLNTSSLSVPALSSGSLKVGSDATTCRGADDLSITLAPASKSFRIYHQPGCRRAIPSNRKIFAPNTFGKSPILICRKVHSRSTVFHRGSCFFSQGGLVCA